MPATDFAPQPAPPQLKMPSGSGRPAMQSSRSSRRGGSSAPKVVLGGGAGMMGSAAAPAGQSKESRPAYGQGRKSEDGLTSPHSGTSVNNNSPFLTSATGQSPLFTSPRVPSPTSPSFPPHASRSARAPSPKASSSKTGTSDSSLASTASSSSRTLKTPHYKADKHAADVQIAGSSGSHDGHPSPAAAMGMGMFRSKDVMASPTPAQPRKSSLNAAVAKDKAMPMMGMSLPPLPPLPSVSTQVTKQRRPIAKNTGAEGDAKLQQRLSQDWVQVAVPSSASGPEGPSPPRPAVGRTQSAHTQPVRLAPTSLVPIKGTTPSPKRPGFDRASTAPVPEPISPTAVKEASQQGRTSLDQLRSSSPSPISQSQPDSLRSRKVSLSTPPALVLQDNKGRNPVRTGATQSRRSEDAFRPNLGIDAKAQQQALGNGPSPAAGATNDDQRKSSGLSLKKSSGALRALFTRGASGKGKEKEREREVTPPMPSAEERKTSMGMNKSRPSISDHGRPSFARPRTPGSSNSPLTDPKDSPATSMNSGSIGKGSFGVDRAMYPAPPMQRTVSDSVATVLGGSAMQSRSPPAGSSRNGTPRLAVQPTLGSALVPSETDTSLAYMARNSVLGDSHGRVLTMYREDSASILPSCDSMEFDRKTGPSAGPTDHLGLGLPTVQSLHLLALPDLDLNFDVSFDRFSGSPTTPRRSRASMHRPAPLPEVVAGSQSPQRSRTMHAASPQTSPSAQRHRAERRRSKSFDGAATSAFLGDMWAAQGEGGFIARDVAKLFANPSSSSAPLLSKQLVDFSAESTPTSSNAALPVLPVITEVGANSSGSRSAESSAMSHDRTPSNGSSLQGSTASPSPSPPRTPPDLRQAFGTKTLFPTRSASGDSSDTRSSEGGDNTWGGLSKAPSVPLPPLPETPAASAIVGHTAAARLVVPTKLALEVPATAPGPKLASPAVIDVPGPSLSLTLQASTVKSGPPAPRLRTLTTRSRKVTPDALTPTKQLLREIEALFQTYRYPSYTTTGAERASMLRTELICLIQEVDKRPLDAYDKGIDDILTETNFQWADAMLVQLKADQPANERGACLETLAAVLESSRFSEKCLQRSRNHQSRFTQLMIKCMNFVMGKLGAKGVFHNTLLFSGRFLAFAFFRIPHIAEQLLTVLPPARGALMRFTRSVLIDTPVLPVSARPKYPDHLAPLCFDDSRSYTARLARLAAEFDTPAESAAFLFPPGNWLRRWQSDDSELFPAFYRAYHRQLANYLSPVVEHFEALNRPVPASILMRAPGYAHLATIFATKCHSYILGSVNAVTTSSSANNFEAQETAGFRGSQKPPVLETANRRIVETISTFANVKMIIPSASAESHGHLIECDGGQLWGDMIDTWTKSIISKTSLWAPKGVFSLFDLLDGIVDPPFDPSANTLHSTLIPVAPVPAIPSPFAESLLDIPHLLYAIRLILTEGEHALTLVKVIAFVFTHWEVLTARPEDRKELCLGLLLTKELFERLTLFWSQSVRSYVLRLVVFRLGHLHTKKEDGEAHEVEIESVKLLQSRLDRIKKRYDELEPKPASVDLDFDADMDLPLTPLGEGGMSQSRSTITMVQDSPAAGTGSSNKAERLLGLGFGMETKEEEGRIGKATNWFMKRVGGKKGGGKRDGSSSRSPSPSPSLDSPGGPGGSPFAVGAFASPNMGQNASPKIGGSPLLRPPTTPKIPQKTVLSSPNQPSNPVLPVTSTTPAGKAKSTRKPPPPTIMTTPHSPETPTAALKSPRTPSASTSGPAGVAVAFEFELPTASPRSDAFDRSPVPSSPRRKSQPPSPRGPASPHMSRSFSKRSSLLPPSTASALDSLVAPGQNGRDSPSPSARLSLQTVKEDEEEEGYEVKKHAYAIRMLAELEDAQKEYDEWWAENGVGRMDGAPPRLTVAWPFHDGDD